MDFPAIKSASSAHASIRKERTDHAQGHAFCARRAVCIFGLCRTAAAHRGAQICNGDHRLHRHASAAPVCRRSADPRHFALPARLRQHRRACPRAHHADTKAVPYLAHADGWYGARQLSPVRRVSVRARAVVSASPGDGRKAAAHAHAAARHSRSGSFSRRSFRNSHVSTTTAAVASISSAIGCAYTSPYSGKK